MPKPATKTTQVVPAPQNDQRQRRKISAEQKARILDEASRCERGQLAALLRREGIYSSQLTKWRAQRKHQGLAGLANAKPGPRAAKDAKDRLIETQQRQIERLNKELRISRALIEMQEKAHEILGIALPRIDDDAEGTSYRSSSSGKKGSQ